MSDPGVAADLGGVDLVGVGGDVVQGVELVDARAGDAERQPREDAAGQHDQRHQHREDHARLERRDSDQDRAGDQHGADDHRRDDQHAALLQPDDRDQADGEHAEARAQQRCVEEPVGERPRPRGELAGGEQQPGHRGVEGGEQGDRDRSLRLVLAAGQHDAADDQQGRDDGGGHAAEHALAREQQRQGAQAEQEAAGAQCRTTSGRGLPRLQLVLHDVGHRLDDVVVDAGGPRRRLRR